MKRRPSNRNDSQMGIILVRDFSGLLVPSENTLKYLIFFVDMGNDSGRIGYMRRADRSCNKLFNNLSSLLSFRL